jgi:hypothetical protein
MELAALCIPRHVLALNLTCRIWIRYEVDQLIYTTVLNCLHDDLGLDTVSELS